MVGWEIELAGFPVEVQGFAFSEVPPTPILLYSPRFDFLTANETSAGSSCLAPLLFLSTFEKPVKFQLLARSLLPFVETRLRIPNSIKANNEISNPPGLMVRSWRPLFSARTSATPGWPKGLVHKNAESGQVPGTHHSQAHAVHLPDFFALLLKASGRRGFQWGDFQTSPHYCEEAEFQTHDVTSLCLTPSGPV